MQTQKSFVRWVGVWTYSAQSPAQMPQNDLLVTPKVSCFSFKYVIKTTEMPYGKQKLT